MAFPEAGSSTTEGEAGEVVGGRGEGGSREGCGEEYRRWLIL